MKRLPLDWLFDALILCVLGGLAYAFGQAVSASDWLAAIAFFGVITMCLLPLVVMALFDE